MLTPFGYISFSVNCTTHLFGKQHEQEDDNMHDMCLYCELRDTLTSIQHIRKLRGMTLRYVSEKIGVSPRTLSKYEQNPKTIPTGVAKRLVVIYNVSIDSIYFK